MAKINVLIVDDCSVTREVIARTLRMTGLELGSIYEAPDGKKGLEMLDLQPVHLLFLDINMPVMDGREMLRRIRSHQNGSQIPILIISSESNRRQIRHFEDLNAGFVHKPFTVEQLAGAVRKLTEASHEQ